MRILLVLGKYLPEKSAGIENYSHQLAKLLLQDGHRVEAAILESGELQPYTYQDVKVIPLKNGFVSFIKLIQESNYDICHFQEYSAFGGIEMYWIQAAKKLCEKVFFTFHLPYLTCYKNDFRYNGIEDCNNFSSPERCVKCIVATKLNYKKSSGFILRNFGIELIIPLLKRSGTINRLAARIRLRKVQLNELVSTCDCIFIYADWFKKILVQNGYKSDSIKKIPYITRSAFRRDTSSGQARFAVKNKLLFVGRIEEQKGLLLLCKAMNLISTENIQLDVFGNVVDVKYNSDCERAFEFNFKGTLPLQKLLLLLPEYDFLVLPSVFTEMYSMILKDALKNQLPVIASAAKGNADIIKEGKNGFIFNYDDYKSLAEVIDKAFCLKLNGWKPEFEPDDSFENGAQEILSYYRLS